MRRYLGTIRLNTLMAIPPPPNSTPPYKQAESSNFHLRAGVPMVQLFRASVA